MIAGALWTLARDGWVVGIAAAAALAYAVVSFVENFVGFVLNLFAGQQVLGGPLIGGVFDPPYSFVLGGHYVFYEPLLRSAILLPLVVVAAALALHATRPREDDSADPSA